MIYIIRTFLNHFPNLLYWNVSLYHCFSNHKRCNFFNIPTIASLSVTLQSYVFRLEVVPVFQITVAIHEQSIDIYFSGIFFIQDNFAVLCLGFAIIAVLQMKPHLV